ncbi:MAG: hypothetical protein IH987_21905 [Planctomycetes bacterium]|nr:hypothetical protein [Planctomycetota bacterium]
MKRMRREVDGGIIQIVHRFTDHPRCDFDVFHVLQKRGDADIVDFLFRHPNGPGDFLTQFRDPIRTVLESRIRALQIP